jgi:hypothetical protein
MTYQHEPGARWDAAGLGNCHRQAASDTRVSTPTHSPDQTKNNVVDAAHRFRRAQKMRRPLLTVQIGAFEANQRYGRSRPYSLSHGALDRLLAIAACLEQAPQPFLHATGEGWLP